MLLENAIEFTDRNHTDALKVWPEDGFTVHFDAYLKKYLQSYEGDAQLLTWLGEELIRVSSMINPFALSGYNGPMLFLAAHEEDRDALDLLEQWRDVRLLYMQKWHQQSGRPVVTRESATELWDILPSLLFPYVPSAT